MTDHADANAFALVATLLTVALAIVVAPDATYEMLFGIPEPGSGPTLPPLILVGAFAIMMVTAVIFETVVLEK